MDSKQEIKSGYSCQPCLGNAMIVEILIWIIHSYDFMTLPTQNDLDLLKIFNKITMIVQDRTILTILNDLNFWNLL